MRGTFPILASLLRTRTAVLPTIQVDVAQLPIAVEGASIKFEQPAATLPAHVLLPHKINPVHSEAVHFGDSGVERGNPNQSAAAIICGQHRSSGVDVVGRLDSEEFIKKMIFDEHPRLKMAFEAIGWSNEKINDVLSIIISTVIDESVTDLFDSLDALIDAVAKIPDWDSDDQVSVILSLIKKTRNNSLIAVNEAVGYFQCLSNQEWDCREKLKLTTAIIERSGPNNLHFAFSSFISAANAFAGHAAWGKNHQYKILLCIANKASLGIHEAFTSLGRALDALELTGWPDERKRTFLEFSVIMAQHYSSIVFHNLYGLIETAGSAGLNEKQIYRLLRVVIYYTADQFGSSYKFIMRCMDQIDSESFDHFLNSLRGFLKRLNNQNRESILMLLTENSRYFVKKSMGEQTQKLLRDHLDFFSEILSKWPYAGYNIFEGLFDAVGRRIFDPPITRHRDTLFRFITETRGFNPALFEHYLLSDDEDGFYSMLHRYRQAILKDEFDSKAIEEMREKYDDEFLLGLIQTVSPVSGMSSTPRNEQLILLRKMLEAGDMKVRDLPEKWRGVVANFTMETGKRGLKSGENGDASGFVQTASEKIKQATLEHKISLHDIAESLADFISAPTGSDKCAARQRVVDNLLSFTGQGEDVKEKFYSYEHDPYHLLLFFEHLFGDEDFFTGTIQQALSLLPDEIFHFNGELKAIDHPRRLIKSIKSTWEKETLTRADRIRIVSNMVRSFDAASVEQHILSLSDLDDKLRETIESAMYEFPTLSKNRVVQDVLNTPMQAILAEKSKYEYRVTDQIAMSLRPVKGPAFALNGLTSGICTEQDVVLWKDPNFKLMAIVDEKRQVVVGYVYIYDIIHNGKKYMTLPGINPCDEFMATVNAKEMYNKMIEQIVELAKLGGYEGVFIPTDKNLSSNVGDIRLAIKCRHKKIIPITRVDWNTYPDPYPFDEVYVVWEKEAV